MVEIHDVFNLHFFIVQEATDINTCIDFFISTSTVLSFCDAPVNVHLYHVETIIQEGWKVCSCTYMWSVFLAKPFISY